LYVSFVRLFCMSLLYVTFRRLSSRESTMKFQGRPALVRDDIVLIVSVFLLSASFVVLFDKSFLDVCPLGNPQLNPKDAQHWCTTTLSRQSVGLLWTSLLYLFFGRLSSRESTINF